MRIVVLLMPRGMPPISPPDLAVAGSMDIILALFNGWILQVLSFLVSFKCNKMLVALRLASIDFILFDTVQLV
jgi:hypothetical protein